MPPRCPSPEIQLLAKYTMTHCSAHACCCDHVYNYAFNQFAVLQTHMAASITCKLCTQPYTSPRVLSCLHSFCQKCLHEEERVQEGERRENPSVQSLFNVLGEKAQQGFKCPTCKKLTTIPVGGVSNLPLELRLEREVKFAQY